MSERLEDEVRRIMREKAWSDPLVLESVVSGQPVSVSDADTLRILRVQLEGAADAIVRLARELDQLRAAPPEPDVEPREPT